MQVGRGSRAGGSSVDHEPNNDQGLGPGGQYSLIHWKISLCQ